VVRPPQAQATRCLIVGIIIKKESSGHAPGFSCRRLHHIKAHVQEQHFLDLHHPPRPCHD
jgi:hypothetical protein